MKRYSEEDKAWLVEEWAASGKTKWAFARELGLPYQTFSKWTKGGEKEQNFVEVGTKLEQEGAEPGQRTGSALVVEQGSILVHLPAGITPQDLAVVVQALR
jgi:transposase-like protein